MNDSPRLLLVDDDDTLREATAALLCEAGFPCDMAPDCAAAHRALASREYRLLISDVHLPGNDDLQLVQNVQRDHPGLPVILISGRPTLETALRAVQLPVVAYLVKPFSPQELIDSVARIWHRASACRTVHRTRANLLQWHEELRPSEPLLRVWPEDGTVEPVRHFLAGAMQQVYDSIRDLCAVIDAATSDCSDAQQSELLARARLKSMESLCREAVAVLEETKRAFKSKRIAQLRRKLESAIDWCEPGSDESEKNRPRPGDCPES